MEKGLIFRIGKELYEKGVFLITKDVILDYLKEFKPEMDLENGVSEERVSEYAHELFRKTCFEGTEFHVDGELKIVVYPKGKKDFDRSFDILMSHEHELERRDLKTTKRRGEKAEPEEVVPEEIPAEEISHEEATVDEGKIEKSFDPLSEENMNSVISEALGMEEEEVVEPRSLISKLKEKVGRFSDKKRFLKDPKKFRRKIKEEEEEVGEDKMEGFKKEEDMSREGDIFSTEGEYTPKKARKSLGTQMIGGFFSALWNIVLFIIALGILAAVFVSGMFRGEEMKKEKVPAACIDAQKMEETLVSKKFLRKLVGGRWYDVLKFDGDDVIPAKLPNAVNLCLIEKGGVQGCMDIKLVDMMTTYDQMCGTKTLTDSLKPEIESLKEILK